MDVGDHFRRVVVASVEPAAGFLEGFEVGGPHVVEGDPVGLVGEVGGRAFVVGVLVFAGADADAGVVDGFAGCAAGLEGEGAVDLGGGGCVFEASSPGQGDCQSDDEDE